MYMIFCANYVPYSHFFLVEYMLDKPSGKHGFYILRYNSHTSAITFYSSTSLLNDLSLSARTDNYGFPLIIWFTTIVQLNAMSRKIYARNGHV